MITDRKWTVDECPDADGYWTIRFDDGTPNGDTNEEVIATVYDLDAAEHIVNVHNCYLLLKERR